VDPTSKNTCRVFNVRVRTYSGIQDPSIPISCLSCSLFGS
jgi:hypothetical protein